MSAGRLCLSLCAAAVLAACGSRPRTLPGDDAPTLASLAGRVPVLAADPGVTTSEEQTIAAYTRFLAAAPRAPQAAEALRRLGDLEMDRADRIAAESTGSAGAEPDYRAAIARYDSYLKAHPQAADRDRVLYQLARAQEQGGQIEAALQTLTQLVQRHPGTRHLDEAQFRRGELLFAMRDYRAAEAAYGALLANAAAAASSATPAPSAPSAAQAARAANAAPPAPTSCGPFHERALYMQGWSRFKQGRLEEALQPLFGVLDLELGGLEGAARDEPDLTALKSLGRAERELVIDTFRVVGIALANLQGAASIASHIDSPLREGYEYRVYQQLGDLYLKQDRIHDAAEAYAAFVRRRPLQAQAPWMQARVVEIHDGHGFTALALQDRVDHVRRFGADSAFRQAQPAAWQRAQPQVKTYLVALARHHHALAQSAANADGRALAAAQAVQWYRTLLGAFPHDADAPGQRFLLAELLFEQRRWAEAAAEYETVAYGEANAGHVATPQATSTLSQSTPPQFTPPQATPPKAPPPQAADAGYGALLALAELEKAAATAAERTPLQRRSLALGLRFTEQHAADPRAAAVLTRAAEQLIALGEGAQAATVARQALARQPGPDLRRTAWTVIAQQAVDTGAPATAEAAWREVLALTTAGTARKAEVAEGLATAIYRQGEAARGSGDAEAAVAHFERIAALGDLAAGSAVRASAQFDAATGLLGRQQWQRAAALLEDFRRQRPGHPLSAEVAPKLALAYLQLGRPGLAAGEFQRVAEQAGADTEAGAELSRSARWQAAQLHDEAAAAQPQDAALRAASSQAWQAYVRQHPQPLEAAVQARWRLAELARDSGQPALATAWLGAVQQADAQAGAARTPVTRRLGGQAALALTAPLLDAYRQLRLVEPLARQLKAKKAKLEALLQAYAAAADVQVAEVGSAATFRTAALYQDFGAALIASARPKKLSQAEAEQYAVMLEEQAFPFEEKAIALHESNARRAAAGQFDDGVRGSYAELARLKPGRWARAERAESGLPAEVSALQTALAADPAPALAARLNNQLGIAQRRAGRFDEALLAYQAAIALAPQAPAPRLNLAILHDLYLGDAARAAALYQACLPLLPDDAPLLGKWLAELKTRKPPADAVGSAPPTATVARKESP